MALPRLFVDAFLFNLHVDEVRPASPGTSFRPRHISDDRDSLHQYLRPTLFVCCSQFLNSSIVPYLFMNEHFSKKYVFHPHIRRFTNLFLQHSASTLQFASSFDTEFFFRDVPMKVALPQFNELVAQKSSYFARSLTSLTVSHFQFLSSSSTSSSPFFSQLRHVTFSRELTDELFGTADSTPFAILLQQPSIETFTIKDCHCLSNEGIVLDSFILRLPKEVIERVEIIVKGDRFSSRRLLTFSQAGSLKFTFTNRKIPPSERETASSIAASHNIEDAKIFVNLRAIDFSSSLMPQDDLSRFISRCPFLLHLRIDHGSRAATFCPTVDFLKHEHCSGIETLELFDGAAALGKGARLTDLCFDRSTNVRKMKIERSDCHCVSSLVPETVFSHMPNLESLDITEREHRDCTGAFLKSIPCPENLLHFKYDLLPNSTVLRETELAAFDPNVFKHPKNFRNLKSLMLIGKTATAIHAEVKDGKSEDSAVVRAPDVYRVCDVQWTENLKSLESLTICRFFRAIFDYSFLLPLRDTLKHLDITFPSATDKENSVRNLLSENLVSNMPNMETLILRGFILYDQPTFEDLAKCTQLKSLEFHDIQMGYFDHKKSFSRLKTLVNLEHFTIDVGGGTRLDQETFDVIFSTLTILKSISLKNSVSLKDLRQVARSMMKLERISFDGCHMLTREVLCRDLGSWSLASLKTVEVKNCMKLRDVFWKQTDPANLTVCLDGEILRDGNSMK